MYPDTHGFEIFYEFESISDPNFKENAIRNGGHIKNGTKVYNTEQTVLCRLNDEDIEDIIKPIRHSLSKETHIPELLNMDSCIICLTLIVVHWEVILSLIDLKLLDEISIALIIRNRRSSSHIRIFRNDPIVPRNVVIDIRYNLIMSGVFVVPIYCFTLNHIVRISNA